METLDQSSNVFALLYKSDRLPKAKLRHKIIHEPLRPARKIQLLICLRKLGIEDLTQLSNMPVDLALEASQVSHGE